MSHQIFIVSLFSFVFQVISAHGSCDRLSMNAVKFVKNGSFSKNFSSAKPIDLVPFKSREELLDYCSHGINNNYCTTVIADHKMKKVGPDNSRLYLLENDHKAYKDQSKFYDPYIGVYFPRPSLHTKYVSSFTGQPILLEFQKMRKRILNLRNNILAESEKKYKEADPCEPISIYLGTEGTIVGAGPIAIYGEKFFNKDTNRITTNFITADDGKIGFVKLISKDALIDKDYYDIALVHELTHGLVQQLYGIDKTRGLLSKHYSTNGHLASVVTDPALAWIEGISIGFEAYLGKSRFSDHYFETEYWSKIFQIMGDQTWMDQKGDKAYAVTQAIINSQEANVTILIEERQKAIRENHFLTKGRFNNLSHKYDSVFLAMSYNEASSISEWHIENFDTMYSKEGVVGHLIYKILKLDLIDEFVTIIVKDAPQNLYDFMNAFVDRYFGTEQYKQLFPTLLEITSARTYKDIIVPAIKSFYGHEDMRRDLKQLLPSHQYQELESKKLKILPFQKNLWMEYRTSNEMSHLISGKMARINLATATYDQMLEYVGSVYFYSLGGRYLLKPFSETISDGLINSVHSVLLKLNEDWNLPGLKPDPKEYYFEYIELAEIITKNLYNTREDYLKKIENGEISINVKDPGSELTVDQIIDDLMVKLVSDWGDKSSNSLEYVQLIPKVVCELKWHMKLSRECFNNQCMRNPLVYRSEMSVWYSPYNEFEGSNNPTQYCFQANAYGQLYGYQKEVNTYLKKVVEDSDDKTLNDNLTEKFNKWINK
ncbi:MAG: hypothetical protein HOE90_00530 [Bacteriovoracaceae bacterium]|jgi:hypothetical protein|nr:hypothetical protein [Bacteriovoracaceae bacterium]